VNRLSRIAALCFVMMLVVTPVFAAADAETTESGASEALITFSPSFGAALVIIGAGYGIGKIGSCAVESMARQPEVANNIQTAMLISAALIEGATFFALIVLIIS
jgi:F-type H+-transporting ATPase subunit c